MNAKLNLPNEIFWGKEYQWRKDMQVNGWLTIATTLSALADIIFAHTVKGWPVGWRVAIVLLEFGCLALWARAVAQWIRGMDELHQRIMTSVMLLATGATFFFMLLWHCLVRVGLFDAIFGQPKPGAGYDIGTVAHGFLLFVLFYGVAQTIFNRRYK